MDLYQQIKPKINVTINNYYYYILHLAYPNCMQDLRLVGEYSLGPEGSRWVDGEWVGSQPQPVGR